MFTQCRNWCFTDFNLLDMKQIYNNNKDIIRYLCYGLEICPNTGRQHYQGWIQFYKVKRFKGVKSVFQCNQIHIEPCKGDEFDNEKYCKKDNNFTEYGKFIKQGQRVDLEIIEEMILDTSINMVDIANANPVLYWQYGKGMQRHRDLILQNERTNFRNVTTYIYYGETGTGKTRSATEIDNNYFKIQGDDLEWFDGYQGEKTLIIDEYSNNISITKLLSLLDGYCLRLPIKGGFTYANWDNVIITTNLNKNEFHCNARESHMKALLRRINFWKKFE